MNDSSTSISSTREAPEQAAVTGELLRGSLLERTIRHTKDCPKCARGEGHRVFVLTVSYGGGRTRQFSVRRERVTEVRRLLANYQKLKKAIEGICELNHELLRPHAAASKSRRKHHDRTHKLGCELGRIAAGEIFGAEVAITRAGPDPRTVHVRSSSPPPSKRGQREALVIEISLACFRMMRSPLRVIGHPSTTMTGAHRAPGQTH